MPDVESREKQAAHESDRKVQHELVLHELDLKVPSVWDVARREPERGESRDASPPGACPCAQSLHESVRPACAEMQHKRSRCTASVLDRRMQ